MSGRTVTFAPAGGPLRGDLRVPSDKSITHRALMIGAVCSGPVVVRGPLWAADTLSTAACLRRVGVPIDPAAGTGEDDRGDVVVRGVGLDGLVAPDGSLDAGNSGTTLRLLAGLLAGGRGVFVLDGDASLRGRPMDRIVDPLRAMGIEVDARDGSYPPVAVHGGAPTAVRYAPPMASAQVKSCVLLAGLHADGVTAVVERVPSRDHTERLLAEAGAEVRLEGDAVTLVGRPRLSLDEVRVPGDPSSAAFLVTAAALVPGSSLTVRRLCLNPTRLGFFEALREMGGDVEWCACARGGEPVGDLSVRWAPLHGIRLAAERVPALIDEVPLLALLATAAGGETVLDGLGELRVKESDRLAAIATIVSGLGGTAEVEEDSLRVRPGRLRGGLVRAMGDHRMAMLGAVAGLCSDEGVRVEGMDAAAVSFPGFEAALREVQAA